MTTEIGGRKVFVSEESHEMRYKLWRRYVPVLYEFVATELADWPASCVELIDPANGHWAHAFEDGEKPEQTTRLMITGTYTGDKQKDSIDIVRLEIPPPYDYASRDDDDDESVEEEQDEDERFRVHSTKLSSCVHDDEVLSARCMPQRSTIIATKSSSALYLYDYRQGLDAPKKSQLAKIDGVALAWSPLKQGLLLTGADNGETITMDVSLGAGARASSAKNKERVSSHKAPVMSVEWHPNDINRYFSCAQNGSISSFDIRETKCVSTVENSHGPKFGVNCVSFNPRPQSNYFLSGVGWKESSGNDEMSVPELPEIKLWDDRALGKGCVHEFVPPSSCILHDDLGVQVYQTRWSPHNPDQFAACSGDGTVRVWDVSRIGAKIEDERDAADGPPELVFIHAGHTDPVSDLQWDSTYVNTFVSVADDNISMYWRPLIRL